MGEEPELEKDTPGEASPIPSHNGLDKLPSDENLEELQPIKSIAESLPLAREIFVVAIVCLAQFTTQVGLGQTINIIHVIGDSFGITDPSALSWLIAGYSLTVGTFIFIFGRMGDLFGYKRMLTIGFAWFSFASMLAGLSVFSNQVMFIFSRVLQGIGPAIILPNGLALLGATYAPGPRKDMVFAIFGATAPGGSIIGATFAGIFALYWWPWAYWSFSIVLAVITAATVFVIPGPPKKLDIGKKSFREMIKALDLAGAVTGVTALVLFNFAWNQAPIVGWQKAYVYVTMIIAILFLLLFFYIETRFASSPLIPFQALSSDVGFVLACEACGWATFGIWIFYFFNFLQVLREAPPLLTVAYASPVAVSGAAASICTGLILSRVSPGLVMAMALLCFTVGALLMATAPVGQTYWAQTFVATIIMPWGMDMAFPAGTLILSNSVPKEQQGVAASLINTVVNYSISLGLGFAGTVEVHVNNGGKTKADILHGYRGALYTGIGLSSLGLFISLIFVGKEHLKARKSRPSPQTLEQ